MAGWYRDMKRGRQDAQGRRIYHLIAMSNNRGYFTLCGRGLEQTSTQELGADPNPRYCERCKTHPDRSRLEAAS